MVRKAMAVFATVGIFEVIAEPTKRDSWLLHLNSFPEQPPSTAFDNVVLVERVAPPANGAVGELDRGFTHHRAVDFRQSIDFSHLSHPPPRFRTGNALVCQGAVFGRELVADEVAACLYRCHRRGA